MQDQIPDRKNGELLAGEECERRYSGNDSGRRCNAAWYDGVD